MSLFEDVDWPSDPRGDPDEANRLSESQGAVLEETVGPGQITWRLISAHNLQMPRTAHAILWIADLRGRWLCWMRPGFPHAGRKMYKGDRITIEAQPPSVIDIVATVREADRHALTDPVTAAKVEAVRQILRQGNFVPRRPSPDEIDAIIKAAASLGHYLAGQPLSALGFPATVDDTTTAEPPQGGSQ